MLSLSSLGFMKHPLCFFALVFLGATSSLWSEEKVLQSTDVEGLKAAIGQEVVVEGRVVSVVGTSTDNITFLNFEGSLKGGFVAVIFRRNYDAFPEGFARYDGQLVRISGPLELFRETQPQIRVLAPAQIELVTE